MLFSEPKIPQSIRAAAAIAGAGGFSALQRAENSSIFSEHQRNYTIREVSVLFSEPKIPQFAGNSRKLGIDKVSVLFSEPKIPQLSDLIPVYIVVNRFQCSSASRKFLNRRVSRRRRRGVPRFQCSSASRKFLNEIDNLTRLARFGSFSALQRAENSSIVTLFGRAYAVLSFSALQRAENSSI